MNMILDKLNIEIKRIYNRPTIRTITKKMNNHKMTGIEIGVGLGDNAEMILKSTNTTTLYLIDPYEYYHEPSFDKSYNPKNIEKEARTKLKKYSNRIVWLNYKSDDATIAITEKVDFVYIDGDHSYKQVKKDIKNYLPFVKDTGIIGGHNIDNLGVICAVLDVFPKKVIHLEDNDWYVYIKELKGGNR